MKVLDPLIEGRRQRTVGGEGRLMLRLGHRADAGQAEPGDQAAGEKFAPVDAPLRKLAARGLATEEFLFVPSTHRSSPS